MRYLLDTHTILWVSTEPKLLSRRASRLLKEGGNHFYVSAVSSFELATKHRLGKLIKAERLLQNFEAQVEQAGFRLLSISSLHARSAGAYPQAHKDPFDRMLAAQALLESLTMISADEELDTFGVQRVW